MKPPADVPRDESPSVPALPAIRRALGRGLSALLCLALILIGLIGSAGCEKKSLSPLAQRGRVVYQSRCIACHNANPKVAGAIGPDVQGSSKELLETRVLHATYPPGYRPKRSTSAMQPLPDLASEIEALHAFLNE